MPKPAMTMKRAVKPTPRHARIAAKDSKRLNRLLWKQIHNRLENALKYAELNELTWAQAYTLSALKLIDAIGAVQD